MLGSDLTCLDDFTLSLLTNKAVLKVLNESENNRQLFRDEQKAAWIADIPGSKAKYVAVFNITDPAKFDPN